MNPATLPVLCPHNQSLERRSGSNTRIDEQREEKAKEEDITSIETNTQFNMIPPIK